MAKKLAKSFNCSTEFTLEVLGGKWKTIILCYLKERPCRYAELRRLMPKLSDKMLSERLRDLTQSGLVARKKAGIKGTPDVYVLTERASSLSKLLADIYAWGREHAAAFGVDVGEPLRRLDGGR